MRFTPFDIPAMMILAQMTNRATPTAEKANGLTWMSRTNEEVWRGRGHIVRVLHPKGEDGEDDPDDGLAHELLDGPQAEAALPGDLDVVVEEADEAEAGHEEGTSSPLADGGSIVATWART